jgi:hypothetical protein
MTTTIQLDDSTKKRLFQIKVDLESERGEPLTYNQLIDYLIQQEIIARQKTKNLCEFRKLKGSLPATALQVLQEERRKELENEEASHLI